MPADVEACVRQMQGKPEIDDPWAFCQWARENSRGPFAHGEADDTPAAAREFAERKKDAAGHIIIPDVAIFEAGDWQGETYTTADLDAMVSNFYRFRDLVEPPVVIGHEDEQELLKNTGIPAAGWVVGLRRRGNKLFADLSQVFPQIADLVEGGAYRHVSAEVYPRDNPPEGVPAEGCLLRRVALLGGSLPHIKSLADLPRPVRRYAERRRSPRVTLARLRRVAYPGVRAWACFSEVRKMADDATQQIATAAIQAKFPDLPPELIDSLTPDQLGMLAPAVGAAAPGGEPGVTGMADDLPPATPGAATTPEEMIAELVQMGEDEAALRAMTPEDLEALYREKTGQPPATPMSETDLLEDDPVSTPTPAPARPKKRTVTEQFSERRLAALEARLAAAERLARTSTSLQQRQLRVAHQKTVRTMCETLRDENRVSEADVEFCKKTGRPIGPVAKALSMASPVRKFGEGGKSELDDLYETFRAKPARVFREQVADPLKQDGLADVTEAARAYAARRNGKPPVLTNN